MPHHILDNNAPKGVFKAPNTCKEYMCLSVYHKIYHMTKRESSTHGKYFFYKHLDGSISALLCYIWCSMDPINKKTTSVVPLTVFHFDPHPYTSTSIRILGNHSTAMAPCWLRQRWRLSGCAPGTFTKFTKNGDFT